MGLFQAGSIRHPRRAQRHSSFATSINPFEDRTLLSGVAIYPQPAAAVSSEAVSTGNVSTAAAPPGNFEGHWFLNSSEGGGSADIFQDGNTAQVTIVLFGYEFPADGTVKGDTLKAKFKFSTMGSNVKGKFVATLDGPTSMAGTASAKISGVGKLSADFTGFLI